MKNSNAPSQKLFLPHCPLLMMCFRCLFLLSLPHLHRFFSFFIFSNLLLFSFSSFLPSLLSVLIIFPPSHHFDFGHNENSISTIHFIYFPLKK